VGFFLLFFMISLYVAGFSFKISCPVQNLPYAKITGCLFGCLHYYLLFFCKAAVEFDHKAFFNESLNNKIGRQLVI
jgi:hypothetical protein